MHVWGEIDLQDFDSEMVHVSVIFQKKNTSMLLAITVKHTPTPSQEVSRTVSELEGS